MSDALYLSKGTYYLKVSANYYNEGNYTLKVTSHTHQYTTTTTKATLKKNGEIVKKCSCGEIASRTTIYCPKSITIPSTSYTYSGKTITPTVTVRDSAGKKISASNYTVRYDAGRKKVGKYLITINFKGNYSGTAYGYFYIYPKKTSISKLTAKSKGFTVKIQKKSAEVSGYQIQYSTNKYFYGSKIVTLSGSSKVSYTAKKLYGKTKYYVRVRTYKKTSSLTYYSDWSSVKTVKTKR